MMNERVEGWQGMDDNVGVTVVIEHVEMKLLEGQWRECIFCSTWAPSLNLWTSRY